VTTLLIMNTIRGLAAAATAALVVVAAALPPVASATPPRDVDATVVWQMTDGGQDYVFREVTIAPGGNTGWHSHPGRLLGFVKQGILVHNRADCSVDGIYFSGQNVVEDDGPDNVHIGRNGGTYPLVLQILYINPAGAPLSVDAPDPGCDFA
jgi:hypothetical protein